VVDGAAGTVNSQREPLLASIIATTRTAISDMAASSDWWQSRTGKTVMARMAFAQPWAVADLPPPVRDELHTPEDRLAVMLGMLFDNLNWPNSMTRRIRTAWAARAVRAQRASNQARDATHPDQPTLRRHAARLAADHVGARQTREEAQAAADAAAAAIDPPRREYLPRKAKAAWPPMPPAAPPP